MKGYETKDFEIRKPLHAIVVTAAGLGAVFVVAYILLYLLLGRNISALRPAREEDRAVPGPLLQTNISVRASIADVQAEERMFYDRESVEPTEDGFYRIPLDSAKQIVLEKYGGGK